VTDNAIEHTVGSGAKPAVHCAWQHAVVPVGDRPAVALAKALQKFFPTKHLRTVPS